MLSAAVCWSRRSPIRKEKAVTLDELFSELNSAPDNKLLVWAVLFEDVYETVHGDGYFAYLADVFFTHEEAEEFAATPSSYRFHIRQIQLSVLRDQLYAVRSSLNRFEDVDLDQLVAMLSHDKTLRKPKQQY
jgi:hypothetical protein